jgi:thiol-disulfide isomerase/thioredoxin
MHALLVAAILAAPLQSQPGAASQSLPVAVGDPAPRLEAVTPKGAAVVEDWSKGDVVVVAFFASWCGPCHRALRELRTMRKTIGPRLRFVLIDVDDDPAAIEEFIAENPLPEGSTVVTDPSAGLRRRWGCTIIPSFFIVDPARTVRYINHGWGDTTPPHFLRRLHKALGDGGPNPGR